MKEEIKKEFYFKDSLAKALLSALVITIPLIKFVELDHLFWAFLFVMFGVWMGCSIVNIIKNILNIRKARKEN